MTLDALLGGQAPILLVAALVLTSLVAAFALGTRLRRRRKAAAPDGGDATDNGYIMSGVLGLLALLLGFTFALTGGIVRESQRPMDDLLAAAAKK